MGEENFTDRGQFLEKENDDFNNGILACNLFMHKSNKYQRQFLNMKTWKKL